MFTGFVPVQNAEEVAKKSFDLSNGTSPFQHDVEFTVTGWDMHYRTEDNRVVQGSRALPILKTTIGDCFISMIIKAKVSADRKLVEPSGTFNKKVREIIIDNRGKSTYDILNAICDAAKDKKIRVSREFYPALAKDGREYPGYLVNLNFID